MLLGLLRVQDAADGPAGVPPALIRHHHSLPEMLEFAGVHKVS
jgi:hypothetical protein